MVQDVDTHEAEYFKAWCANFARECERNNVFSSGLAQYTQITTAENFAEHAQELVVQERSEGLLNKKIAVLKRQCKQAEIVHSGICERDPTTVNKFTFFVVCNATLLIDLATK